MKYRNGELNVAVKKHTVYKCVSIRYKHPCCKKLFHRLAVLELTLKKGVEFYADEGWRSRGSLKRFYTTEQCRAECLTPTALYIDNMKVPKKYLSDFKIGSIQSSRFKYTLGKEARPTYGFSQQRKACASGIHFFFSKKAAQEY